MLLLSNGIILAIVLIQRLMSLREVCPWIRLNVLNVQTKLILQLSKHISNAVVIFPLILSNKEVAVILVAISHHFATLMKYVTAWISQMQLPNKTLLFAIVLIRIPVMNTKMCQETLTIVNVLHSLTSQQSFLSKYVIV